MPGTWVRRVSDDQEGWTDRAVIEQLRVSCSKAGRELKEGLRNTPPSVAFRLDVIWAELQTAAAYAERYLETGIFGPEPDERSDEV